MQLTTKAIESIMSGKEIPSPVLQVLGTKKIAGTPGSSADRFRLLLSDGELTYSSAMLATQLNHLVSGGQLDNHAVIELKKFVCNSVQDRKVLILLDVEVIESGTTVGAKLGNPQPYKAGAGGAQNAAPTTNTVNGQKDYPAAPPRQPLQTQNSAPPASGGGQGGFYGNKPAMSRSITAVDSGAAAPARQTPSFQQKDEPQTPGGTVARVTPISAITPYQNKWVLRARVSQKSNIRTWSNSRGEGKLFSINLLDESGEIRATAFKEQVDKYYELIEVGKVYYLTRASVKTANKQYCSVDCEYELTFNSETSLWPCDDQNVDLPSINFNFVAISRLEGEQPNTTVDVIGVVKHVDQLSTVTGKQSNKEIKKRDVSLVDDTQAQIRLTLWGQDAESFKGDNYPVLAVKGCRLSDFNGRSLSALSSSQIVLNPDVPEGHKLRGWFDSVGLSAEYVEFRREGGAGGSQQSNFKTFADVKSEPPTGDQALYYATKATVLAVRKENSMYMACPTEECNKKLVDQANGLYRCEKCGKEYNSYKWRIILSMNLGDHTDNQWVTAFQESAESILGKTAQELGFLKDNGNESELEELFHRAQFHSYMFKLRAKVETYNDESRLKTVCMQATPVNYADYAQKLIADIEKLSTN